MASSVNELEDKLKDAGNTLLNPPSDTDQLLSLLDKLEQFLINVEQAPSRSMQEALLPSMKALISHELLRHSDETVRISVASCIIEMTRITAPDAPYNDEQMKEIFQLAVAAFEKLSHVSSHCYEKALSILDTFARVRLCLVMLDLECDALIFEMFEHFFRIIRPNHPHGVFSAMETIMTLVLDESEEMSLDLLKLLLGSVIKESQTVSPIAWTLGEKVITNCAVKLRPCLMEAVQSMGKALDDFAQVVSSICQSGSEKVLNNFSNGTKEILGLDLDTDDTRNIAQKVDGISESKVNNGSTTANKNKTTKKESLKRKGSGLRQNSKSNDSRENSEIIKQATIMPDYLPRKRGWKPNSLRNPEEGYDHYWISPGRKTAKPAECRTSENYVSEEIALQSKPEKVNEDKISFRTDENTDAASPTVKHVRDVCHRKRGRPKKSSMGTEEIELKSVSMSKEELAIVQVDENAPATADVSLKKNIEDTHNSEFKPSAHLRKNKVAAKSDEGTAQVPGLLVPKMEPDIPYDAKEQLQSVKNVGDANLDEERPVALTGVKKKRRSSAVSASKKLISDSASKSLKGDTSCSDATPKRKNKGKPTSEKEGTSRKLNPGERLVGRRIKVWWPLDKIFYEGIVCSYDPPKKRHKVLYTDGDEETLNLMKQRWEQIDDIITADLDQKIDVPIADTGSLILQKRRGKANGVSKRANMSSSTKRSRASVSISKSESIHASGVSVDGSALNESVLADGSVGGQSVADVGKNSSGKRKIKRLKTGSDSERTLSEGACPRKDLKQILSEGML